MNIKASVAQWLEHWFRKPGVESSILSGGFKKYFLSPYFFWIATDVNSATQMHITASVAQWLEHWFSKPGVESSLSPKAFHFFFFFTSFSRFNL